MAQPFAIDPAVIEAYLEALAAARPKDGAATPEVQAANLAAFSAASRAMSETFLALVRVQLEKAGAGEPEQAAYWLEQIAEAAGQAGTAMQARLLADMGTGAKDG